ncbi:MAG TPA: efflux RND transporter periplasmic adaptor subunit [Saprospiraceae bacterium]
MKKYKIIRVVITLSAVIGVFFLMGWVLTNNKARNEAKTAIVAQGHAEVPVRVKRVEKQSLLQDLSVNGKIVADQELNFASENSGRVIRVLVDEGDHVKKGQTLAVIKADQLNVDVEAAQAAYQNALRDKERFESAFSTGGVTQQQLDQSKLNLETTEARLRQAKIRVSDTNIKSSINGIVNKRYVEPGAVVSPGTQLFELVDISSMKLKVSINEAQIPYINVGDKVTVKASVYPDKSFEGKITFIAPKADNTLSFPVEIKLSSNPGYQLKAGMYGSAHFHFDQPAPIIAIPRNAFVGSVASNQVYVIEGGKAHKRDVVAGRIMGDVVEILQGLGEDETVVTSGQINLIDGSAITILQ